MKRWNKSIAFILMLVTIVSLVITASAAEGGGGSTRGGGAGRWLEFYGSGYVDPKYNYVVPENGSYLIFDSVLPNGKIIYKIANFEKYVNRGVDESLHNLHLTISEQNGTVTVISEINETTQNTGIKADAVINFDDYQAPLSGNYTLGIRNHHSTWFSYSDNTFKTNKSGTEYEFKFDYLQTLFLNSAGTSGESVSYGHFNAVLRESTISKTYLQGESITFENSVRLQNYYGPKEKGMWQFDVLLIITPSEGLPFIQNNRIGFVQGDLIIGEEIIKNTQIINETTNTYTDLETDTSYTYTSYTYDYSTYTYNITLENGAVQVIYGDDTIDVTEDIDGVQKEKQYQYYEPDNTSDPEPSQPPDGGGDDDGGFLGVIARLLVRVFEMVGKFIGDLIGGALGAVVGILEALFDKLGEITLLVGRLIAEIPTWFAGFGEFLGAVFSFLPEEFVSLILFGILASIVAGIVKKFM